MPLLSDAKNCFVGQTQIKQIFSGTQKVWPKVPNLPTPIGIYDRVNVTNRCSVLFSCKDISCADMFNIYIQNNAQGVWTASPYSIGLTNITNNNGNFGIYKTSSIDQFLYDDMEFHYTTTSWRMEVRKNGTSSIGPEWQYPSNPPKEPSGLRTNQCT
jgi:hypothetical protein